MAVPTFEDFNKRVTDLFKDDYTDKLLLKIKHSAPAGVSVTSETEFNCNCNNDVSTRYSLPGKVTLKWKHASGFALDKLQIQSGKEMITETSMVGVAPGLKFTFKGNDEQKGDLGVEYGVDNARITGDLDVVHMSKLNLSGVFGYQKFLLGGCLSANLPGDKRPAGLEDYTVTGGYSAGPLFASLGSNKFSTLDVNVHYLVNKYVFGLRVSKPLESASSPLFAVGGICTCSPATSVRFKLFNDDKKQKEVPIVAASIAHTPAEGVTVIGTVQSTLANLQAAKAPQVGFQVTLG